MTRNFVNKIPAYYDSNTPIYLRNSKYRGCEIKWIRCNAERNYHVLSWSPTYGQKKPDPGKCEKCEIENKCSCDSAALLAHGCKCGGK
jgi:hypothetical protein